MFEAARTHGAVDHYDKWLTDIWEIYQGMYTMDPRKGMKRIKCKSLEEYPSSSTIFLLMILSFTWVCLGFADIKSRRRFVAWYKWKTSENHTVHNESHRRWQCIDQDAQYSAQRTASLCISWCHSTGTYMFETDIQNMFNKINLFAPHWDCAKTYKTMKII